VKKHFYYFLFAILPIFFTGCSSSTINNEIPEENKIDLLKEKFENREFSFLIPGGTRIDSVTVDEQNQSITIMANEKFSYRKFRDNEIVEIYDEIRTFLGPKYYNYNVEIFTLGFPIEELVPNFYRTDKAQIDSSRIPKREKIKPLIVNIDKGFEISNGLQGRHIALWHSHGWYYNHELKR